MRLSGILTAAALLCLPATGMSQLVISEVVEGTSGNFKYVEILNRGASAVDLTSPQISLRRYANGGTAAGVINLTGTLPANGRYVVANNQTDYRAVFGVSADASLYNSTNLNHNGNDSFDLYDGTTVLDAFAGDWIGVPLNATPYSAADGAFFRVLGALPNNGNWGGPSNVAVPAPVPPATDSLCPSGFWTKVPMTASNANAASISTPFAGGGAELKEVPVSVSAFSID